MLNEVMFCCVSLSNLSPSLGLMFGIQPTHSLRGDLAVEGGDPQPRGAQARGATLISPLFGALSLSFGLTRLMLRGKVGTN